MTRKVVKQILPQAALQYDVRQMNLFIDTLNKLIEEVRNPLTNIPNMPTEASLTKLVPGDLYRIGSEVHIVLEGLAYTLSVSGTGSVGTVTVITNVGMPSGVSASGSLGSVNVITNTATPTVVTGTGSIGTVTITTTP
jgi:hypothetical protein